MARAKQSEMVDALSCGICFLPYNLQDRLPKVFPCQHTVCLACAQGLCQQQLECEFPCPQCRQIVSVPQGGASDLQTNLGMTHAVEIMQKTPPCFDSSANICPRHPPKHMTHLCMTCTMGLCAQCFTTAKMKEHLKHELRELDDAVAALKQTSDTIVQLCSENLQSLREECKATQNNITLMEKMITTLTEHQYPESSLSDWLKNLSNLHNIIVEKQNGRYF